MLDSVGQWSLFVPANKVLLCYWPVFHPVSLSLNPVPSPSILT